jgi:hypothetical protein
LPGDVSAAIHDGRMTITMQNYGLTWADPDGTPRASAVAYDQPSAERQKERVEGGGCSSVEIVPVAPGQLPEPQG